LTKIGAALALISTIVGGGIVGLPFAFYYTGLGLGVLLLVLMAIQTVYSVKLYLAAKDFLPGLPESLFEIGFILYKRSSIFYICAIIIVNSFGLMMIYFIVFGDTLSSLVRNLSSSVDENSFFG
jgi:amino acid permease